VTQDRFHCSDAWTVRAISGATRICAMLAALTLTACISPAAPIRMHGEQASGGRTALLISDDNDAFQRAVEAYVRDADGPTAIFRTRERSHNASLVAGIRAFKPDVLVVLGGKALKLADRLMPDIPALVGLTLDDKATGRKTAPRGGVSLELPPRFEFMMYKLVLPELQNVHTFYDERTSRAFVESATDALAGLGIRLRAHPVEDLDDFRQAFGDALPTADAIWLFADPTVTTPEHFHVARELAWAAKKPLLCSTFAVFAREGALMAVAIDYEHVGAQLAAQARSLMRGQAPADLTVQAPVGGKLVLNEDVAAYLGVTVPVRVRPLVGVVSLSPNVPNPKTKGDAR
jgi:ABC-type uncharacterized transport system substrate-binding protein